MRLMLSIHIAAGALGIISGFVALCAAKGARLHRRSGMLFVCAMLTMCVGGATLAMVRGAAPAVNVPAALVTAYLVITALTTVRPLPQRARWLDLALMLMVSVVGVVDLTFGFQAIASPTGRSHGFPAFPFLLFGTAAMVAVAGDVRVMRAGPLRGAARLARHLWRMSFALLIAAMSFFLGQARVIPRPIRIMPLLMLPILVVLVTMLYWLWRVRMRRTARGAVGIGATTASA